MGTKVKDVIDLDFDPDILSSLFGKLSVESSGRDCSDSLSILKNEPLQNGLEINAIEYCTSKCFSAKKEVQNDSENKYNEGMKNCIKTEDVENYIDLKAFAFSCEEASSNVSVKKEAYTKVCEFVKSEPSSDSDDESSSSDSDDDDSNELLERGGPEKIRRHAHKQKQYERPARTNNAAEIDPRSALFLSSSHLTQSNSTNNLPQNVNSINYISCSASSPDFVNVSSPDSGYAISPTSGFYFPSPTTESNQTFNEDAVNEERQIQSIFGSLIDICDSQVEQKRSLDNSQIDQGNQNIPILDDFICTDYIEQAEFLDDISYNDYTPHVQETFNLPVNIGESLRNNNGEFLALQTNEIIASDNNSYYIPFDNLLEDLERSSNLQVQSNGSTAHQHKNSPTTELNLTFNKDSENEERLECSQTNEGHFNSPNLDYFSYADYSKQAGLSCDISFDDYTAHMQEILNLRVTVGESLRNNNGEFLGLQTNEIIASENDSNFIPFDDLLEDLETSSKLQVQSNGCTVPQHENVQSPSNALVSSSDISNKPVVKRKERKICFKLRDFAQDRLRSSESFDRRRYREEVGKLLIEVKRKERCMEKISIIEIEEVKGTENFNRTNLQNAVLNSNIEKVFSIVELQKKYSLPLFSINHRDVFGKTALNYAIERKMLLIIDYLAENLDKQRI